MSTRRRRRSDDRLQTALAGFAHEVRTPLNGILVLAELLAAADLPPRERGWAETVKTTAEHLSNLTNQVVDRALGKDLALREQPFGLAPLVHALAATLQARTAVKGLEADLVLAPDLPELVVGDAVRLRAAMENLLDNAVKFTARGSVRLAVEWAAGWLRFTVTDTGIGLSQAEIRRLFRPFAQANTGVAARFGGAGLGLTYAAAVARAGGGRLTVDSKPGQGSAFCLAVRVTKADGCRPSEKGSMVRGLHILCAEDNPFGRIVLQSMAEAFGHTLAFVGTGEAAVAAAESSSDFDLVLLDVQLPEMDGIEAATAIRKLGRRAGAIPVVMMSGHNDETVRRRALEAGATAFLAKPIAPAALAAALSVALSPDQAVAFASSGTDRRRLRSQMT